MNSLHRGVALIGALCAVVGVYVVLRGLSFIGAGIAHASFGGVALGFLALFGWRQYGEYRNNEAETAAAIYLSVKDATEAKNEVEAAALLGRLRSPGLSLS